MTWIIIVALLLIAVLPKWDYSHKWGYFPSGGMSLVLIFLIIMMLMGKI